MCLTIGHLALYQPSLMMGKAIPVFIKLLSQMAIPLGLNLLVQNLELYYQ
jgi:hypothetical protein